MNHPTSRRSPAGASASRSVGLRREEESPIMTRRVFVTGAGGYLGSGIAARLARGGFAVTGLVRDAARASALATAGVRPVVGDFDRPASWDGALRNADAVVHAAWSLEDTATHDQKALAAIRDAIQDGRVRRLLYTSGLWVCGDSGGRVLDESAPPVPFPVARWRAAHEEVALDLADFEVDVLVMRPAIVYGEARGLLGAWFEEARESHTVTVPGNGEQFWPLIHRDDASEAFALALDHGQPGERFHLCDESQLTAGAIGRAIAAATGADLRFAGAASVIERQGACGEALLGSQKTTSAKARRELGWVPFHTDFTAEADDLLREWSVSREASVA
jgi:nucleoside-diphosphate-sugar epimerase